MQNFLFVVEQEYEDFTYRRDKDNRVWLFWMDVLNNAPFEICSEIQTTYISLLEQPPQNFKITGVAPFQFKPLKDSKVSEKLSKYLDQFIVFVEFKDPKRFNQWSKDFSSDSAKFVSKHNATKN